MIKQKYKLFPNDETTRCGDCNTILTTKDGKRLKDGYFYKGIRCRKCYNKAFPNIEAKQL